MKAIMLTLAVTMTISVARLTGQQDDFQVWASAQLNLEIIKKLKVHIEEEVRFNENSSLLSRQINDIGASYRMNKHLKAGLFYRLEADWKNADDYAWRNGLYGYLSVRTNVKRFTLGYRLRLQSAKVERNDAESDLFDGFRHRHKLSVEYDVKGMPLVPFIDTELFVGQPRGRGAELRRHRSWIGLDYTYKKTHTFTVKYGIDRYINTRDPLTAYIVAVGYTLDIKLMSNK